jgi:hypothetical protein
MEAFIHQQWPEAQRVELCVGPQGVQVARGWDRLNARCEP